MAWLGDWVIGMCIMEVIALVVNTILDFII